MKYLHTMVRVADPEAAIAFYCDGLGMTETRRVDSPQGRFTLIFLAAPGDLDRATAEKAPNGAQRLSVSAKRPKQTS